MNSDFSVFFSEYEALVAQIDAVFQKVAGNFASEVKCRQGCSDCCHALFDLTLIEAMYLNSRFAELEESRRNAILIEADKADRKAYVFKKKASREAEVVDHSEILLRTAQSAGMTEEKFNACITDEAALKALNERVEKAIKVDKITATPSFIVNGKKVKEGEMTMAELDAAVAEASK